jgi:hypothetical protein
MEISRNTAYKSEDDGQDDTKESAAQNLTLLSKPVL